MEQVKRSNWAKRQAFLRLAGVFSFLVISGLGGALQAAPLLDTRVGGLALVGPSSPHLASAYYNPATLSLSPGSHVLLDGTVRLGVGGFQRRAIDTSSGVPGADLGPEQSYLEVFPQFFLGMASDLGTKNVVLSLFACTPVAHRIDLQRGGAMSEHAVSNLRPRGDEERQEILEKLFDPDLQGAAKYQLVDFTLYNMHLTLAAAYRIIRELSVGISVSYVFGSMDLAFTRDAALEGGVRRDAGEYVAIDDCGTYATTTAERCNYENSDAAQAVRTRGQSHGLAFGAGLLWRAHENVDVGLGYNSEVVGVGGDDIPTKGDAWVGRSRASINNWEKERDLKIKAQQDDPGAIYSDLAGRSTVTYKLPHQLQLGVSWRLTDRLLFNAQVRWQHLSTFESIDIQLTGTEFRATPRMPDRINLYRGYNDLFSFQVGGGYLLLQSLVIQGAVMLETGAVPDSAVTVGTIDSVKVDMFVGLSWRVYRGLAVRLGYGVVLMPAVDSETSDFSPALMVECVDRRYSVDSSACKASARGQGMPSSAGRYSLTIHRVGLSLSYDVF